MEPTLVTGDCVLVRKGRPAAEVVSRGVRSVVVLRLEHGETMVKRLIAGPGDTVMVRAGSVMVNGVALREPYVATEAVTDGVEPPGDWHYSFLPPETRSAAYVPTNQQWGPLVVPASAYFVLGDNRRDSGDSRLFGFVKPEEIIGVPRRVFWSAHLPRIRPHRIGARL